MLKEEAKQAHPFSKITRVSLAANAPTRNAREEWSLVHSYEEALKWHIKWTPWFTKDMIEGMLKYAYPSEILKEEGAEELLGESKMDIPVRREASTNIKLSPIEIRRSESIDQKMPPLMKTTSEGEIDTSPDASPDNMTPEEIQKRLNRFWTLNL